MKIASFPGAHLPRVSTSDQAGLYSPARWSRAREPARWSRARELGQAERGEHVGRRRVHRVFGALLHHEGVNVGKPGPGQGCGEGR